MRKQRFVLALAGLLVALGLNAQNITVNGTVKDNTGERGRRYREGHHPGHFHRH